MSETNDRSNLIEAFATILLSVAAVATAWTTYQSTQWRGEQASHGARSTAARIESSTAFTSGGQLTQVDIATFTQWVNATVARGHEARRLLSQRFRDEFTPAFNAWFATNPLTNPTRPRPPSRCRSTSSPMRRRPSSSTRRRHDKSSRTRASRVRAVGQLHARRRALRRIALLRGHLDQAAVVAPP